MSRHPLHLLAVLVFLLLSFPASRSLALTATFNSAADIPVTSSGYTASGSLTLVLNFSPSAGTALTVVKNTAITPISGTFAGLPQGGTISAVFAGHTYNFIAHYWAGTGNDLVLVWPDTGLVAWGANTTAAIGDGSTTNRLTPVAVNTGALLAGKTILATAGGYLHSLALTSEGKVYAWGDNSYGQLGDGTTTQRAAPVQVVNTGALSGKTVVAIAAGAYHSLALTSEGKLYAWGNDFYQQLGDGSGADGSSTTPVVVNMSVSLAGKTVVAIAAGGYHNLALSSDGLLHAWGDSLYGQTGGGLFNVVFISPVSVTSVDPAVSGKLATAISAGAAFSLALLADGTVAAWGRNFDGQLGDGTTTDRSQAVAIVQNGALAGKTVTGISAGGYHSVAVSADGKLYGWGSNATYQVGNGSGSNALVPVETSTHLNPALTGKQIVTAAAGLYHSMALTDDGVLVTWGYAGQGALGNGSTDNRSWPTTVPIFGVLSNRRLLHLPAMSSAQHSMMTCSDAPDVKVEDSGASPVVELADGGASSFGNVLLGQNVLRTFTVQNNGTLPLTGMSVSVDGTHSADFTITQQPATTLAAGASTTFVARFAPGAAGTRTAALHLASNDPDEVSFDIAVSGNGSTSTVLSLTMASAGSIPLSTSGFVAGGLSLSLTLGFAPQTGANLTVIDNGGLAPIGGRFSNVAQGATVTLTFAGVPYNFIATYWGGTGNDLLLLWPATAMAAWGSNANGNLGDNTHTNSSVPVNVIMTGGLAGKTIAAFSRGGCSVGLTTEGKAYSWGNNLEYQLGTAFGPNLWPDVTQPIEVYAGGVLGGKTLVAVSAGYPHSLTLDTDGHVYAWGYRGNGVLGNGGAFTTPGGIAAEVDRTGVLAGKFIVSVSAGTLSSLALASDGQAFAWGLGTGDGTATERWSPVAVDRSGVLATRSVTAIAAGNAGGLAVTSDGRIAAWGSNTYGNLGDGTTTTRLSPVLLSDTGVLSGKVITRVATNGKSSYALASDGSLFAWGYNAAGDLGDGTTT